SEEHTSELQSLTNLVCRLLLLKKQVESGQCDRLSKDDGHRTTNDGCGRLRIHSCRFHRFLPTFSDAAYHPRSRNHCISLFRHSMCIGARKTRNVLEQA